MIDEPWLEPYSCDVDDESRFLYCFLTSSVNSSHRATLFRVCSFLPYFFPFYFFLEQRHLCVVVALFIRVFNFFFNFNLVRLPKGENELEMVE